jgi:hypothetical protein
VDKTEEESEVFMEAMSTLVQRRVRFPDGRSLLHIAMEWQTSFVEVFISDFPNVDAITLLVECGEDVNAANDARNTPLHLIAEDLCEVWGRSNFEESQLIQIAELLISKGAHMDAMNSSGLIAGEPLQFSYPDIFSMFKNERLQCIAARCIQEHQIPHRGILPVALSRFVDIH